MYCSCDYYDGESTSSFVREEWRKAKKTYRCEECARLICVNDKYHYSCGVQDGDMWYYRHCEECWDLLTWIQNNLPCYCFVYNDIFEYASEQLGEAEAKAPEETKGLWWEFQRRYYKIHKKVCRGGY